LVIDLPKMLCREDPAYNLKKLFVLQRLVSNYIYSG
jgi:hypothetical protein